MTHGSNMGGKSMNYTKGGFPVWDDAFDKEHFTAEEIAESDMRAAAAATQRQLHPQKGKTWSSF